MSSARPGSLFRTTAFRVALANAAAFGLVALLLCSGLFWVSHQQIVAQIDGGIVGDRGALLATLEDEGLTGLTVAVERRVEASRRNDDYYLLLAADGRRLAGNLPIRSASARLGPARLGQDGWSWRRLPVDGAEGLDLLRINDAPLPGGGRLLVGRDPQQIDALQEAFLSGLLWTELGILVFGLLSGYLVSRRVLAGVQVIADAAEQIGAGKLGRRIPAIGGGSEIAVIGTAINTMLDRIGALTDSLREVTNDIAHDLRTPLGRLRQTLEQATLSAASEPALRAAAERALAETDNIVATFNALLRIAQIEAQERRSLFAPVELSALLERLADAYGPAAEEGRRRLHLAIAPGVRVFGDADMLGQLVANLIENALRHTPAGAFLQLAVERTAAGARLVVADNGPGIAADQRERVLQRFVRLDASRGTPGSGLGLALVKAIADLHGVALRLEDNAPGLRATLEFFV